MNISFTRDSCCMSDDMDAPHLTTAQFQELPTEQELFDWLRSKKYLPSVVGGSSWLLYGEHPIFLVFEQWSELTLKIINEGILLDELTKQSGKLHFRYYGGQEPNALAKKLKLS